MNGTTVLVAGLGDLGTRVLDALAVLPSVERLVGAGRNVERGRASTSQAALVAQLSGGPRVVAFERLDLEDRDGTSALLSRLDPDLIVMAASRHTWWRLPASNPAPASILGELPYGVWLPVLLTLVQHLMEARRAADVDGMVICLPFPDAVGPALRPLGLAPEVGAGNITEVAAKLALLAAKETGVPREEVDVRLVIHHAAERVAFPSFASLGGADNAEEPPWWAQVTVAGRPLADEQVRDLLTAPYPLPPGTMTHTLTAAATAHLVDALLSDWPRSIHAPAPAGLPGGYPLIISRQEIELDLPPGLSDLEAVNLNQSAARWDGLEHIGPDGTISFTASASNAIQRILGLSLSQISPADRAAIAEEILERASHPKAHH